MGGGGGVSGRDPLSPTPYRALPPWFAAAATLLPVYGRKEAGWFRRAVKGKPWLRALRIRVLGVGGGLPVHFGLGGVS